MKYVMIMIAVLSAIMPMQASDSKRTFALCVGASCVVGLVGGYLGAKIASRPTQAQQELARREEEIRGEQSSAISGFKDEVERLKGSLQAHEEQARTDREKMQARVDQAESRFATLAQSTVNLADQVRIIASGLQRVQGLYHEIDSKVGAVQRRFVLAAPRSPTAGYPDALGSSDEEGVSLAELGNATLPRQQDPVSQMRGASRSPGVLPCQDLSDADDESDKRDFRLLSSRGLSVSALVQSAAPLRTELPGSGADQVNTIQ